MARLVATNQKVGMTCVAMLVTAGSFQRSTTLLKKQSQDYAVRHAANWVESKSQNQLDTDASRYCL